MMEGVNSTMIYCKNFGKVNMYPQYNNKVAHTSNPSYSGSRDQEDCSLKPVQVVGVVQGVGPEFKPQHHKKNHIFPGL
jgi:hypothetical protein